MIHNSDSTLTQLATPALILDEGRMLRNIRRLRDRIDAKGVSLRPHLKTAKSVEIARLLLKNGCGPGTVSTLGEAQAFAAAGAQDLIYAVGIAPQKLDRVAAIRASGCDLVVLLDSAAQARAVVEASERNGRAIPALIEIDCDGHRAGLRADDPAVLEIGNVLHGSAAELRGVLTHAGGSYGVQGSAAHARFAEQERAAAASAAEALRAGGLPCPVVSIGSSPTAHAVAGVDGVTEVRAGVYVFFDLVQVGLGVCALEDIAVSVLTTVIGHQREKGWALVDAGWMALSQDRGTQHQAVDQGYGLVCDAAGEPFVDIIVASTNQEHGIVAPRPGSGASVPDWPVGTLLRVLPNHACSVAAQFDRYEVISEEPGVPMKTWPRIGGW